jgi:DNA-binding transcriptional MerR regulator
MIDRLPGTTIETGVLSADGAKDILDNIFICGGLMMSQVARLTGLEPYMIQNWVKRGFLSSPKQKLYTKRQFCRIAIINMLRDSMQIEKITGLLSYINGRLDDESDDIIDDSELYLYYIAAIEGVGEPTLDEGFISKRIETAVEKFREPFPGAKNRLIKVISVMLNAHFAAIMRKRADEILATLD